MQSVFANCLIFSLLLLIVRCSVQDRERVLAVVEKAKQELYSQRVNGSYWLYPAFLGTNFISEYYVLNFLLGHENDTLLDPVVLRKSLLEAQLRDGSWQQVPELNKITGEIDTTIFNYWALKVMGTDIDSAPMAKARQYILSSGGLDSAQTMTKFWLSVFGNYNWDDIGYIPLFIFYPSGILSMFFAKNMVAQWVYPHLLPMAYARNAHLTRHLDARFSLRELALRNPNPERDHGWWAPTEGELEVVIERMLEIQQPMGSFGAYTVSSLFTIVCMQDFIQHYPHNEFVPRVRVAMAKAFSFIEMLYFKSGAGAYKGVLDDGRYWDTALAALALIESGEPAEKLMSTYKYFADNQLQSGAIPYGLDFEYSPDTDDTALATMFMCKIGLKDSPTVKRSLAWLKTMQNDDGGFPAFDKGKQGNFILSAATYVFTDSSEPFDPSCVDLTGHIIETFGACGYTLENDFDGSIKRAVDYIKKEQQPRGEWEARWGINYVYAAGSALPGLRRVGIDITEGWLVKSIDWLIMRQNPDGGFGESSLSYKTSDWAGRGVSTPSQTAWTLLALLEVREKYHIEDAIERAVEYLVKFYETHQTWVDESSVGTGHRKIVYMTYPAYPHTFTLIALGRYLKLYKQA